MVSQERRRPPSGPGGLRRTAEEVLAGRGTAPGPVPVESPESLRHEVDIQRVELEMQNEELQRTCEDLRDAHDRYLKLYEFAPVGYVATDGEGFIRTANLKFAALAKTERIRLGGVRLARLVHEEDRPCLGRLFDRMREAGASAEVRFVADDGSFRWVLLSADPALDDLGQVAECFFAAVDISERKRIEAELARNEERLRLAVGAAHVGIFDWDISSERVHWTAEHDEILGFPPAAPGTTNGHPFGDWMDRIHPGDLPRVKHLLKESAKLGKPFEAEYRVVRPGGVRWVSGQGEVSRDPGGRPVRMVGTTVDITARREMENDLKRSHETLERRVEERTGELAIRVSQLRALSAERILAEQHERRRMAKLLHDHLQQLLVSAKFRVELLTRVGDDLVRRAAEEIEGLLAECIGSSRSLTTELSPPVLLEGNLAAGLNWLARWMADKHGLKTDLTIDEDLPPVAEDVRILLFEAVRELLFNAVKHARVHLATVLVRWARTGFLRITVCDEGSGFDPGAVTPAGETGGGLGLFSIRERLDLIGGTLEIDSVPGRGSRIVLTVPLAEPVPAPLPEPLPAPVSNGPVPPAAGAARIRVLLADDHAILRDGLARFLGTEEDIEVVGQAADGRTAIEMARRLRPDVILMDLSMPGIGGVDATRALLRELPALTVIGLSMFVEEERIREILAAGAAAYVSKSDSPTDILRAIRAAAGKTPPAP